MSKANLNAIIDYLTHNAGSLRYGTVSAKLRIHDGRVVSISYETTECTKKTTEVQE